MAQISRDECSREWSVYPPRSIHGLRRKRLLCVCSRRRFVLDGALRALLPEQPISSEDLVPYCAGQAVFLRSPLDEDFTIGEQMKPFLARILGITVFLFPRFFNDSSPARVLWHVQAVVTSRRWFRQVEFWLRRHPDDELRCQILGVRFRIG